MSLRLIASRLVVETDRGRFQAALDFSPGLNVISARNSQGKTTALMGVIYALGMEGMLGPGQVMPLKPAAYELITDTDGSEVPVRASYVLLELENAAGARLTCQRWIKHDRFRRDLVRVWPAGKITNPEDSTAARDLYTRLPGSASQEAGWHTQLQRFAGWDLPEVATYEGTAVPLYMQVFFPLLCIEQIRGWAGIWSGVPRYLRVRDPGRRAVEFLMSLDANDRARRRDMLRAKVTELQGDWRTAIGRLSARLDDIGGRVTNLPSAASVEWPPATPPIVEVGAEQGWIPLDDALRQTRRELGQLSAEVPKADDVVGLAAGRLRAAEASLGTLSAAVAQLDGELRAQRDDIAVLTARQEALEVDRQRYSDAIRLRDLGSLQPLSGSDPRCPTCDQNLPETLHGADLGAPVLTLEANLQLIDEERDEVSAMRRDAEAVYTARDERSRALQHALRDARREVRTLKSALVQESHAPSEMIIARRIRLTDRLEALGKLDDTYEAVNDDLTSLASELREVRGELTRLGVSRQSEDDRKKLLLLRSSLQEQLAEYRFESIQGVEVDLDSYLPVREGVDLVTGTSASDTIRLIWAYSIGLLDVARSFDVNHPGLLMMDEPGQQQMDRDSLRALVRRASACGRAGQQVILTTSMPFAELDALQPELGFAVTRFSGRVVRRELV